MLVHRLQLEDRFKFDIRKIVDLTVLEQILASLLITSDLQFGLKRGHSIIT
jgi:hypothetical protein